MSIPTPTNGINAAVAVSLAGTNLVQLGTPVVNSKTSQNTAPSGTQFAAWFSGGFPGGASFDAVPGAGTGAAGATDGTQQYGLTLSLSSKTLNGVVLSNSCVLTTTILDNQDNTQSQGTLSPLLVSYASPTASSNSNWNPKTASTGFPVPTNSNGQVVTVSGSTITAVSVGQAVIDVQFPFDSNTMTNMSGDSQDPVIRQAIYAQILVQVIA